MDDAIELTKEQFEAKFMEDLKAYNTLRTHMHNDYGFYVDTFGPTHVQLPTLVAIANKYGYNKQLEPFPHETWNKQLIVQIGDIKLYAITNDRELEELNITL